MSDTDYTTPEQIEAMRRELAQERERLLKGPRRNLRAFLGRAAFEALVLLLAIGLISVLRARSRGEIPSVLGLYLFSIESGSMEPTLPVGSVILARAPRDPAALKEGDIVTFRTTGGDIVTHRILAAERDEAGLVRYVTKGDNPVNSPDPEYLTPERVIAVFVLKIPLT